MTDLARNHYKETTPDKTVERLLQILNDNGLETEEIWSETSSIDTYSLRVNLKGTSKGTNGKGISKEFARASAYAELFERLQNCALINPKYDIRKYSANNFIVCADEKLMTADEIVDLDNDFIKMYFNARGLSKATHEEKVKSFLEVNRVEYYITGKDNLYVTVPFYDVKKNEVTYLPYWAYSNYYGSNGMSAGNSIEEAIVQGISEIMERIVQKRIFTLKNGLPDIPEDYLKTYPELYARYACLKSIEGFNVSFKDCSFGGQFPVVGLLIVQKNTGKYGIKLGCHPDFGIAFERTLTEATQGNDIVDYVNRSYFDFLNRTVNDSSNIVNSYKVGLAQYPYEIFSSESEYKFQPFKDVSDMTNKALCKTLINKFIKKGYDVLIRDVSNFSFPSCHIVIPEISELVNADDARVRAYNTRIYSSVKLQDPSKINETDCKYIMASIGYFSKSLMENTLESYYQDSTTLKLPFSNIGASAVYFAAMGHVFCGDYNSANEKFSIIESRAMQIKLPNEEQHLIRAIGTYLRGMIVENSHKRVMKYLALLFDKAICQNIEYIFADTKKILSKQFPNVSLDVDYQKNLNKINDYSEILKKVQATHPVEQMELSKILL